MYDLKQAPVNYFDTLFVVEHPEFADFGKSERSDLVSDLALYDKLTRASNCD